MKHVHIIWIIGNEVNQSGSFPFQSLNMGSTFFFQQQCLVRLPSATDNEIRSAYRRRALSTHPDKGGSAEAFRSVVSAFETLTLDIPW